MGHEQRLDAHIVNYADDFVICCRGTADEAMTVMRGMMPKLKLTVNETKTRLCRVPDEAFDFLGYTIGRLLLAADGPGLHRRPAVGEEDPGVCAASSVSRPSRRWTLLDAEEMVGRLNRMLRRVGELLLLWGRSARPIASVDSHACHRLRQWLGRKHKVQGTSRSRFPDPYLHDELGLVQLQRRISAASRGRTRESLSESRMREIRTSGSMSGRWKRSMGRYSGTGNRKGRQHARLP